jgi:hypothetical protein
MYEVLVFCVSWGIKISGAACIVAGYSFSSFYGEFGILAL